MGKLTKIALMIALCVGAGVMAGVATQSGVNDWYPTIEKPTFNPPSWVFAPIWTILYILMGIAAGLVWHRHGRVEGARKALIFFFIQLALNILWSFLFFKLENPFLALIEIILLWLMIWETIVVFKRVSSRAANLMWPYLLWVSFATILNGSIWWLNR